MIVIASPAAIIGGARAARAASPSGQGAATGPTGNTGPSFGQISPLVSQLGGGPQAGYATGYSNFLPRLPQDFQAGAFGPFSPVFPMAIDQPPDGAERAMPRRLPYQVGWNLPVGQPGTEGVKQCDFQTLRSLASLYSVARACIELLKAEIRGLEWDIIPTKDASKAMRGDAKAMSDFGKRRAEAVAFFKNPDPEYGSWGSWLSTLLEDFFVVDAMSVYLRPTWGKGKGLLGSDLTALEPIAGDTLRPLYDLHGSRPRPPAPAFQQYLWGVPRVDLMQLITQGDLTDELKAGQVAEYRGDQLLYMPYTRQTISPYGLPPIERALVPIMSGLGKQQYQMDFFREGSIPGMFISPGDVNMTPSQIRELQDALNALAGDVGFKHKIIVLPPGSKTDPQKPPALADQFDEVIMAEVCMAFNVMPMEIGLTPKVSMTQSPGAANQMAKASQDIHARKSLIPTLQFLKESLFDKILQVVCKQDDLQWMPEGLEQDEDEETLTTLLVTQVGAGLASIDEARAELNKDPWGVPITSDPLWASQTGIVPLASLDPSTGQPVAVTPAVPGQPAMPAQEPGLGGSQPPPGAPKPPGGAQPAGPASAPAGAAKPAAKPATSPGAGNAGQTPGHEAAEAGSHVSAGGRGQNASAGPAAAGKAAWAELDALERHLRKGRDVATWETRHLPAGVLEVVRFDLGDGQSVSAAVAEGRTLLAKGGHG